METTGNLKRSRLALVTWGHFVNDSYIGFFTPILPLLIEKLALSLTVASGLAAIPAVVSSVFQPLYGMASDRTRGRFFILLGPLLSITGMGLIGIAPNAMMLGLLLLVAGVGAAAFHPQAVAAAGTASGNRKGLGISVFLFGGNLVFALGPLAIIAVVQFVGLERSYLVMLPGFLSVVFLGLYLQVPTGVTDRKQVPSLTAAFRGARTAMALLFSITVIREFTRLAVVTFLPIFLSLQGRSLMAGGITLALFSLSGAVGGMVAGGLSDRWGRKHIILVSGVLCVPFSLWDFSPSRLALSCLPDSSVCHADRDALGGGGVRARAGALACGYGIQPGHGAGVGRGRIIPDWSWPASRCHRRIPGVGSRHAGAALGHWMCHGPTAPDAISWYPLGACA